MEDLLTYLIPCLIILGVLYRLFAGFFRGASSDAVSREYLGLPQEGEERERIRAMLERRAQQRQRQAQEALQRGDASSSALGPEPWERPPLRETPAQESPVRTPLAEQPAPSPGTPPSGEISPSLAVMRRRRRVSARGGLTVKGSLATRWGLRQAILVREILGAPRGQQPSAEERP
jgi:hypothetical protein